MTDKRAQKTAAELFQLANNRLPQLKEQIKLIVDFAEHTATETLSPNAKPQLVPGDRLPLERAVRHLRPAYDVLVNTFDRLYAQNPIGALLLYGELHNLASSLFQIGVRATVTDSAKKYFAEKKAADMRAGQAPINELADVALKTAIEAACAGQRVAMVDSDKFAQSILSDVRERLAGYVRAESGADIEAWRHFRKPTGWPRTGAVRLSIRSSLQEFGR